MRLRHPLATTFLLAATAAAQVSTEQFEAIRQEATERSQVMGLLDHLVNRIGPRLTSSDNLTVACEWARDTFTSFGLEAGLEQWGTYPIGFNRGPWWGRMTRPEPMELVCNTDAWTAGTRRPSRGPLVRAPRDADELAKMRGFLANVWLLDPPRAMVRDLTEALLAEGGFGFVTGTRGDLLLTGGNPVRSMDRLPQLPTVRLRGDHHAALVERLDDNQTVEVEFDIRNHFRNGPIPLYNVIADLKGTEFPDEYVVVGGHIDSWDGATGTTDNGTGTATTLEAARILMAIGARPRRTIRFMLWSGEEQGLQGSAAWVQAHSAEMPKYSACLVHDGGTNYVSGIAGMKEMHAQLQTAFAPVLGFDPAMPFAIRDIPAFSPIGSDHESFFHKGVPGFFWNQAGSADYTHTHHTQYDTFDAAIPEYQRHSALVIATGALGLANLPTLLTREGMKVSSMGAFGPPSGRRLGVILDQDVGTTIEELTDGSVAQKSGLKVGDRLLRIGTAAIKSQRDVRDAIANGPIKTSVTVQRGKEEVTVEVTFDQ